MNDSLKLMNKHTLGQRPQKRKKETKNKRIKKKFFPLKMLYNFNKLVAVSKETRDYILNHKIKSYIEVAH